MTCNLRRARRFAGRILSSCGLAITCLPAYGILNAQSATPVLDFQVSTEIVPAGSKAQVKLFLLSPQPISQGTVFFTFNGGKFPSTPPSIGSATVFSASGDVAAIGAVSSIFSPFGLSVWFSSPSAGVGRIAGLPILEFSIPVTDTFSVDIDLKRSNFFGPNGNYTATVKPGGVMVGGTLSVRTVTPTGSTGILQAGSVLRIEGTGFTNTTSAQLDGVSVASVGVIPPDLINVTLAAATEITGKRIRIRNANGAQIDYWGGLSTSLFTFPFSTTSSGTCSKAPGFPGFKDPLQLVLQNSNPAEAQVTVTNTVTSSSPKPATISTVIPGGETYSTNISDPPNSTFQTSSSTPVRSLCFATLPYAGFQLLTWVPVTSQQQPPPSVGFVANAASQVQAGVSPGEIISIYGAVAGQTAPAWYTLDDSGMLARDLNGFRVLFDRIPSPLLYASGAQINAVVPYEIAGGRTTTLQVEYNGVPSAGWGIPVIPAAPGIFTMNSTGQGQASVLNQDNSVNSSTNPAPRSSVIQIFATGEGLSISPGVTGSVAGNDPNVPRLPVSATIGGVDAPVLWAGSSPGAIVGLLQVNAQVPATVRTGNAVPIVITVVICSESCRANNRRELTPGTSIEEHEKCRKLFKAFLDDSLPPIPVLNS